MKLELIDHNGVFTVIWPKPEDYGRFVEICTSDNHPETYVEFVQDILAGLKAIGVHPNHIERIDAHPDEMLRWCMAKHGNVGAGARASFAMFMASMKFNKARHAIN